MKTLNSLPLPSTPANTPFFRVLVQADKVTLVEAVPVLGGIPLVLANDLPAVAQRLCLGQDPGFLLQRLELPPLRPVSEPVGLRGGDAERQSTPDPGSRTPVTSALLAEKSSKYKSLSGVPMIHRVADVATLANKSLSCQRSPP